MTTAPRECRNEAAVLLVDDEVGILEEYREWFELRGIDCGVESDALNACRRIIHSPGIKVVVTDLRMPGLNGADMIVRLREGVAPGRDLRFIICSGYCDAAVRDAFPEVPIIEKPVDPARLADQVCHALRS